MENPTPVYNHGVVLMVVLMGSMQFYQALISQVIFIKVLEKKKEAVINFPNDKCYDKCMATIRNNGFENDEITMSGLTAEHASKVDAPLIKECFLNLECRYLWEKEIKKGSTHVLMCLEVVSVCIDENHLDETIDEFFKSKKFTYKKI